MQKAPRAHIAANPRTGPDATRCPVSSTVFQDQPTRAMAYLESTYAELGCARPERWAQAAFAAYLGVVQLAAMRPSPLGPADLEELVGLLQERLVP